MSPKEAAEQAKVTKMTILKWIKSGRLPAETVETKHGPGYEIRPEDLLQAINQPKTKREPKPVPVQGSVAAELEAMRKANEALVAELHDLRAQLHQTEQRLMEEIQKALPPRTPEPEKPAKRGFWPFRRP